jgi:hypothetical protein
MVFLTPRQCSRRKKNVPAMIRMFVMPSMKSVATRAAVFVFGHVVLIAMVAWFAGSVSQANNRSASEPRIEFQDVTETGSIRR